MTSTDPAAVARGPWVLPQLRSSAFPTPQDLITRRGAAGAAPTPAPAPGVAVRSVQLGDVACVMCSPPGATGCVAYFHGGGYRLGSAERSTPFASRLAEAAHATVVVIDYRLAPEHPFPAALRDAAAVYDALLSQGEPVVVAGDSAGGGLAAALTVAAAASGRPLPSGLVLMSPWLDLTCTASTFTSRSETDELFSLESARQAAEMYLQGHEATDPLASPGLATLDRWPPVLALASAGEVLLEDSARFASTLALSGATVTLQVQSGVAHAWPAVFPDLPASSVAVEDMGRFVKRLLG